jgi:hypothetical protein
MLRKCAWLLVLLVCALPALADSKARIVRLSYVEGDVELDRGDGSGFVRAFQNMPVIEGVRLWTRSDARVEVEFEDGGTLRMVPDSLVNFDELRLGNSGEKITRIDVQEGTLYADLKDHEHDQLAFTFAQQQLTLRHSSRFRLDIDKEQLKVAVFRGDVDLQRPTSERVKIKKNETLAIDFAEPERYYLSKGITEEAYDYWDRDREEQRVVAEQRNRTNTYPVSTVYYGYDDLTPYGSWVLVPTYGYVWRPFGVALAWDPFAYGAWVQYPQYGYVWTSAYPWGWTPYRYGSWIYITNRGWCWRGGPRINITNINIINPPPRYVVPRPPVVNNTTIVVVNAGRPRPADPRAEWMPRLYPRIDTGRGFGQGATSTPGVFTAVAGNERPSANPRRVAADDVAAGGDAALTNTRVGSAPRDVERIPGVSTKTAVNGSEQVKTRDGSARLKTKDADYNAVDYRRPVNVNRDARPATFPSNDVAEASRMNRGRPDPDREDVSRPPMNRTTPDTGLRMPDADRPQPNSAPGIDRNRPDRTDARSEPRIDRQMPDRAERVIPPRNEPPRVERSTPEPRVDRPAPQPRVERSAPAPRVDRPAPTPRASAPERSSPPPAASVQRSSPPPSPPPSAAPASRGGGSRPRSQ